MEVSSGSIGQGETLICIPSDRLVDDTRGMCFLDSRLKKRHRLVVPESTTESHNNVKSPTTRSSPRYTHNATTTARNLPENEISRESSVDSSGMAESDGDLTEWSFEKRATFCCESPSLSSDVISAIDYEAANQLIATGGLARKIRIWSYNALEEISMRDLNNISKCNFFTTICMPAKLSSLKWRPQGSEVIGCGDYDGSVTEWDVEYGSTVSERYDHTGKTVWSIDYSREPYNLLASASSDGTVRFWCKNVDRSVGVIKSSKGNSMCCAEFSKHTPWYVAVACADTKVYVYDTRNLGYAVMSLRGHERSVSYVRWLGDKQLVSSSPDGTVKLWDLTLPSSPIRTYEEHINSRNFVGLSVADGGLIATGSETNEVFVYCSTKTSHVFQTTFPSNRPCNDYKAFVGSVCWTKQGNGHFSLISANSEGVVQVIQATHN